ncbi:LPS-assembly protein LptD [Microvirga terricola]|uniref:LPS-assembly protein LptD n=1 Tax=Microvirga terricola TaxID=2719797 RepID=A0ABX0VB47_9HYPH|nr:LPS-assembly protein LptD [Microvirga terricola]NIX77079.1 LPS-assembly protein LptD [Microvirga terricola]
MARLKATIATSAVAVALLCAVVPGSAFAQKSLNETLTSKLQSGQGKDRLLVEAKAIVYDNDKNTIAASGDVQMNYQGKTLQADRVIYDRNTGRVFAEGNAKLTDATGAVVTGERFELTDDFKNGFIDSLRVVQSTVQDGKPVTTRFSSPRAERAEGETTVFERGTYTACEPCKENPEKPPLWQVKAAKIIHNNSEQTIYYEDATLEIFGLPVAYLPYFWTPDPTVKRKTGFLSPRYVYSSSLGFGLQVPFFWAIAPNYDLTLSPTYLSRQGLLGQAEWRHRLDNGAYNIRAAGIDQQDSSAFLPSPFGPGDRDFRGSLESAGMFYINDRWKWGWDVALLSDKWFLQNYRIKSESLSTIYLKESISTLYLQGQGDRSFFDLRGYYFQGLSSTDWQKQQPVVHPVLDYNKRVTPAGIGGEFSLDVNVTSLSREAAAFQQAGKQGPLLFGLYETCAVFERGVCLVRGMSGTDSRASVSASWRREFIDPVGQVWTPFAYVRADNFWFKPDFSGFQNIELSNFFTGRDEYAFRGMPGIGLEYRFPFVADLGTSGTQTLEPIAQIIARPNETRIGRLPNEDAQSLIFDDTSLFNWDKFTGYDRAEGGLRANVGLQYTVTGADGFYANVLFGQSYQLAGLNSFRTSDLVNTGVESGLDSGASDYVGRFQLSPNQNFSFITRARFDQHDFGVNRLEAGVTANFNPYLPFSTSLTYARYAAQPAIGFDQRREGLLASATWNLTPNWYVSGSVLLDLDRNLLARQTFAQQLFTTPDTAVFNHMDKAYLTSMTLGLGYADECTTLTVNYTVAPRNIAVTSGEKERTHTVLFRLELRTLGEVSFSQNIGSASASQEGVAAQ